MSESEYFKRFFIWCGLSRGENRVSAPSGEELDVKSSASERGGEKRMSWMRIRFEEPHRPPHF